MAEQDHNGAAETQDACPHCAGQEPVNGAALLNAAAATAVVNSAMNDDQFGNLLAAILTAGTLAASHRGLMDAKTVPHHFMRIRSELRAAGIIHRNRMRARRGDETADGKNMRRPEMFGEAG